MTRLGRLNPRSSAEFTLRLLDIGTAVTVSGNQPLNSGSRRDLALPASFFLQPNTNRVVCKIEDFRSSFVAQRLKLPEPEPTRDKPADLVK